MSLIQSEENKCLSTLRKLQDARAKLETEALADEAKLRELRASLGAAELSALLEGADAGPVRRQIADLEAKLAGSEAARPQLLTRIRAAIIALGQARAEPVRKQAAKLQKEYEVHVAETARLLKTLEDRTLFNFDPPGQRRGHWRRGAPVRAKLSGFAQPSRANAAAFEAAVDEVAHSARRLMASLTTSSRRATAPSRPNARANGRDGDSPEGPRRCAGARRRAGRHVLTRRYIDRLTRLKRRRASLFCPARWGGSRAGFGTRPRVPDEAVRPFSPAGRGKSFRLRCVRRHTAWDERKRANEARSKHLLLGDGTRPGDQLEIVQEAERLGDDSVRAAEAYGSGQAAAVPAAGRGTSTISSVRDLPDAGPSARP